MSSLISFLSRELQRSFHSSPLQMALLGLAVFFVAAAAGPDLACGSGNGGFSQGGAFSCLSGEMSIAAKALIVLGLGIAALCWGRAVSLLEHTLRRE